MINREWFDVFSVKAGFCVNANPEGLAGPACLLAFVFLSLCLSTTALAQSQLGTGIDGEAAGDSSGYSASLSSDGNRLAIGAVGNDVNGEYSGHVRVYQWSGESWTQLGVDIDGESAGDWFGYSVSLSSDGSRLAIGARQNDGNGQDSGHVRIFQWSGEAWAQLGADIDGESAGDWSGSVSLSSDGNRVAIGARWNWSNNRQAGHVRVYQWSNSAWVQLGLDINGDESEDQFGRRVSLSSDGNRLAVGAPYANESLTLLSNGPPTTKGGLYGAGLVRVYQWSDSVWAQVGNDIDGEALGDRLGEAVSLSADGNRMAIGIPSSSGYERSTGRVRVFQWSGSAWTPLGTEIVGEAVGDQFGRQVSLSQDGNRLAIGTPWNDVNGEYSGHVRVYQWSGESWTQLGVDIDGESAGDWFGVATSLSPDGNRLAVGAWGYDSNGEDSGRVRVYDLSMFNVFRINAGLNDAWYNPETSGQGFFITIFPEIGYVSLAWFTYDTELPPIDATANLGDPGHRWLTAVGPIDGNQALMNIEMTSGGLFDTASEITRTDPPGSDGTILLTFDSCNSGTIEYDVPSINRQGIVPIKRVANDNIVLCEALSKD